MQKEIIIEKIQNIEENIDILNHAKEDFKIEKEKLKKIYIKNTIAKLIEEIIENAIKINNIILKENNDYANNYFQTFSRLKEYYKFDEKFLEEIAKTTSFRNIVLT